MVKPSMHAWIDGWMDGLVRRKMTQSHVECFFRSFFLRMRDAASELYKQRMDRKHACMNLALSLIHI